MLRLARQPSPPLVALGIALVSACTPGTGARSPAATSVTPAELHGLWIGHSLTRNRHGLYEETRSLWRLTPGTSAQHLAGEVEHVGGLSSPGLGRLECNQRHHARVTQKAEIREGRVEGRRISLRLGTADVKGDRGCQGVFPLGPTCQGQRLADGSLRLACGDAPLRLTRPRLDGVYAWEERQTDRLGDTRVQRDVLHLRARGTALTGFVDLTRGRISGDGQPYICNGQKRYAVTARILLSGRLDGALLKLKLKVEGERKQRSACTDDLSLPTETEARWWPLEDRLELALPSGARTLVRQGALEPDDGAAARAAPRK
jgi:hypothetical protein